MHTSALTYKVIGTIGFLLVFAIFRDMPSFAGIQEDCEKIIKEIKEVLDMRLKVENCDVRTGK